MADRATEGGDQDQELDEGGDGEDDGGSPAEPGTGPKRGKGLIIGVLLIGLLTAVAFPVVVVVGVLGYYAENPLSAVVDGIASVFGSVSQTEDGQTVWSDGVFADVDVGGAFVPIPGTGTDVTYSVEGSWFIDAGGRANAWGGHSNGHIPASALCPVPWAPRHIGRCDSVRALEALNVAFRAEFGVNLAITDFYRSFQGQVNVRQSWCNRGRCHMAATPGHSNHGWAIAVDFGGGINRFYRPEHRWMVANAGRFGWFHPTWARQGGGQQEPWHWQYVAGSSGRLGLPTTPTPDAAGLPANGG